MGTVYTILKSRARVNPVSVLGTDRIVRAVEALQTAENLLQEAHDDFNLKPEDYEFLKSRIADVNAVRRNLLDETHAARTIEKHKQALATGDGWENRVDQAAQR